MLLTSGAVACLNEGAELDRGDVNAVYEGRHCECGQVVYSYDLSARKGMISFEFQPVLKVLSIDWQGTQIPNRPEVRWMVTDGTESMLMMAPSRTREVAKVFFSKNGPYHAKKLKAGMVFKLLDYTTSRVRSKRGEGMENVVFVEKIRAEPKQKKQTRKETDSDSH
jgi:hypothetical protein